METDHDPHTQIAPQITLEGILNTTVDGTNAAIQNLTPTTRQGTSSETKQQPETLQEGTKLKGILSVVHFHTIVKASHHKTFMETCLTRNQPPRNMKAW